MKAFLFGLFVVSVLAFTSYSDEKTSEIGELQVQPVEHRLVVKVIGGEWRVVHANDTTKSTVVVKKRDRIRWVVEGSDASFQFPDSRIVGHNTRVVKAGTPMVLVVTDAAVPGNFAYSVFVHKSMEFARGESPPRIIIE